MTREEVIAILHNMKYELSNQIGSAYCRKKYDAMKMAIEALQTEPCEDCVSRQNAIRIAEQGQVQGYEWQFKELNKLPPVQPKQRWISVSEKLPESDEDVLVTNGRGMYVGWIDPTDMGWRVDSGSEYFMNDIIAWRPLPEPFKEEGE